MDKEIIEDIAKMLLKQGTPGSPPRAGLVFDRSKHRWIRPGRKHVTGLLGNVDQSRKEFREAMQQVSGKYEAAKKKAQEGYDKAVANGIPKKKAKEDYLKELHDPWMEQFKSGKQVIETYGKAAEQAEKEHDEAWEARKRKG